MCKQACIHLQRAFKPVYNLCTFVTFSSNFNCIVCLFVCLSELHIDHVLVISSDYCGLWRITVAWKDLLAGLKIAIACAQSV